ncbi:FecR family protein [Parapedobacter deserti]|uniref:FecR family protein n=2 Tax=Parapedobacter deserti TaxID=1912957 RepID=A0ABV7JJK5_9SPHI
MIRYFRGQCQPHEIRLVKLYRAMDIDHEFVESCLKEAWLTDQADNETGIDEADVKAFSERFFKRQRTLIQLTPLDRQIADRRFRLSVWMKAAVAVILVVSAMLLIYNIQLGPAGKHFVKQENNMLPGADKASLTLADGSTISLSEAANGKIVEQAGIRVEKSMEGEIVYRADSEVGTPVNAFNSVVTPNGGQYRIVLPDGSKVWLNAASSLTYPVPFSDEERRVTMTGEAYFEIVKWSGPDGKKSVPFIVDIDKQRVEVLGTKFNINAYEDETAIETSLIEGSVRVTSSINNKAVMLSPGQKSVLDEALVVETADIQKQLAWTTGRFIFKEEFLGNVMRQISRWYDIDIVCPPHLERRQLTGIVSRSTPIEALVETIESTSSVKITRNGRRWIVSE